jgi:uncharacterized protein
MSNEEVIQKTVEFVKKTLKDQESAHDWWHILRVWNNAKLINQTEKGDGFVIELAALLHDIADWKFHNGDITVGPKIAREWLQSQNVSEDVIKHVEDIILNISFKGAGVQTPMKTIEGQISQDADRLDAIGAVGIARVFAYGGAKGREMHNPELEPVMHQSFGEYKKQGSLTAVNHFYEKLLLLKDRMNTQAAKTIAHERHQYMEQFLDHFYKEWDGKRY